MDMLEIVEALPEGWETVRRDAAGSHARYVGGGWAELGYYTLLPVCPSQTTTSLLRPASDLSPGPRLQGRVAARRKEPRAHMCVVMA